MLTRLLLVTAAPVIGLRSSDSQSSSHFTQIASSSIIINVTQKTSEVQQVESSSTLQEELTPASSASYTSSTEFLSDHSSSSAPDTSYTSLTEFLSDHSSTSSPDTGYTSSTEFLSDHIPSPAPIYTSLTEHLSDYRHGTPELPLPVSTMFPAGVISSYIMDINPTSSYNAIQLSSSSLVGSGE